MSADVAMVPASRQLAAFRAFVRLVSEPATSDDYAAQLRKTLNPFLADSDAHQEHVDAILHVYAAALLAARVRLVRSMLASTISADPRTSPARVSALSAVLATGTRQRAEFDLFATFLSDARASVTQKPGRIRAILDAFMDRPERHRAHADAIVDAYTAAWLASHLPVGNALVARALRRQRRGWKERLDALTIVLEQENAQDSGYVPIKLDVGLSPVKGGPLPRGFGGYAGKRRIAEFEAKVRMEPDEGFRARRLALRVDLRPSATLLRAEATLTSDGRESSVRIVDKATESRGTENKRELGAKAAMGIPHTGSSVNVGASRTRRRHTIKEHGSEELQRIEGGVLIQADASDQTAWLDLKLVHEHAPTAGDGGLPLAVTLELTVLVPVQSDSLEAELEVALEAGWYKGRGTHRRRLELPALTADGD